MIIVKYLLFRLIFPHTGKHKRPTVLYGASKSGDIGSGDGGAHDIQRVSLHIHVRTTRTATQHLPSNIWRFVTQL